MPSLSIKRRHRRRAMAQQQKTASGRPFLRAIIGVCLITGILLYAGNWVLDYFGAGNSIRRIGTTVVIDDASIASVSIEGSELKRAENGQKLYPGDRLAVQSASQAELLFFDETRMRLNELTDITLTETYQGEETSNISIRLQEGMLWIQTPEKVNFSGSIVRSIRTPAMTVHIPSNTEALLQPRSIVVYSADGLGITIEVEDAILPVIVGEGQKFTLPANTATATDLYAFRSPLDPMAIQLPFVENSRKNTTTSTGSTSNSSASNNRTSSAPTDGILTLLSPSENAVLDTSTVTVTGRVQESVARVRVNGYNAAIQNGTFIQELALPDEDEIDIVILALAADGTTLSEISRKVQRNRTPPPSPTITLPAQSGETYTTNVKRLEIRGQAPAGTVGIIVNDYRLQLFEPGDRTWTYLASTSIDNYKPGRNEFKVYAINAGGYKSEPAKLIILLDEEGNSTVESSSSASGNASSTDDTANLPNNDPLQPGSIAVVAPSTGNTYTATESSFLIEGITPANTASFWINNYRLRLYEAGKTTWNYIADINMGTLSRGKNTYEAVARDSENRIIDTFTYTVEYQE